MLVTSPDSDSKWRIQSEARVNVLGDSQAKQGLYHFSPLCKLPRSFLDRVRCGRLHLLIRKRLLGRLVGCCVLWIGWRV
jgi:hypothetical protein